MGQYINKKLSETLSWHSLNTAGCAKLKKIYGEHVPMSTITSFTLLLALLLTTGLLNAEEPSRYYAGVGFSGNLPDNDGEFKSSAGFQFFGGYRFDKKIGGIIGLSAEVGYHDSGDFDSKPLVSGANIVYRDSFNSAGIWLAGVFNYNVYEKLNLNAKIGLDLGDDDGTLIGVGAGYPVSASWWVNLDYIMRESSDSAQFNVMYQF